MYEITDASFGFRLDERLLYKMKKKIISLLIAALMLFSINVVSFAAYETQIPVTAQGNSTDLIYIKRPQTLSASTSDRTYTISAVGPMGTNIRVYKQVPGTDYCEIIKSSQKIGASGLYSTVVDLTHDSNKFVVYAENGATDQVVTIEISKVKKSTVEKLKSVTVNILNFLR